VNLWKRIEKGIQKWDELINNSFFNNKTNNVGITTVADLIDKEKYKKLCNVLIDRYQKIEKEAKLDLSELNLKEMRLVASMSDFKIKESMTKRFFTYV
jgi:hypothetical protein